MGMSEVAEEDRIRNALEQERVKKLYEIKIKETTIDNTMAAMRQIIVNTCDQLFQAANVHKGEEYLDPFCKALVAWIQAIKLSADSIRIGGKQDLPEIQELVEQATGHVWSGISDANNKKAKEMNRLVEELQDINKKLDTPAPKTDEVVDKIQKNAAPVK